MLGDPNPFRPLGYPPELDVAGSTLRVLVEQVAAVAVQRLGARVRTLSSDELWTVDEALRAVLGLE